MAGRWRRVVTRGLWLLTLAAGSPGQAAYRVDPGAVPVRSSLPTALDLVESGLVWLQDMTATGDPRDPATLINRMEAQAARYFDFAYMAYRVAGPDYTRLDLLQRSHFQNRLRDALFSRLAAQTGLYDVRPPRFRPLRPVATSATTWRAGGVFAHAGGPVVFLYFDFYLTPGGWRIFDVSSNGVSAVGELRRRFFDTRLAR